VTEGPSRRHRAATPTEDEVVEQLEPVHPAIEGIFAGMKPEESANSRKGGARGLT
jgi:hypothetical protein